MSIDKEHLKNLDPEFDFKNTYKVHLHTLVNLQIAEATIGQTFTLDGEEKELKHPAPVYLIRYREWQNKNWFPLINDTFWSTNQKAKEWFDENINKYYDQISEDEAYKVADQREESAC